MLSSERVYIDGLASSHETNKNNIDWEKICKISENRNSTRQNFEMKEIDLKFEKKNVDESLK